jgi:hypothetical protein
MKNVPPQTSPWNEILFLKSNVINRFYENKQGNVSKFSHNWQVLAGLV